MTKEQQRNMANRIKAQRVTLGYTQEQFSEQIDISYGSYVKIENAFQKPSLDTLIRISENLGVTLDFLVFGGNEINNISDGDRLKLMVKNIDAEAMEKTALLLEKLTVFKKNGNHNSSNHNKKTE